MYEDNKIDQSFQQFVVVFFVCFFFGSLLVHSHEALCVQATCLKKKPLLPFNLGKVTKVLLRIHSF